jgi:hypothetical protein
MFRYVFAAVVVVVVASFEGKERVASPSCVDRSALSAKERTISPMLSPSQCSLTCTASKGVFWP